MSDPLTLALRTVVVAGKRVRLTWHPVAGGSPTREALGLLSWHGHNLRLTNANDTAWVTVPIALIVDVRDPDTGAILWPPAHGESSE